MLILAAAAGGSGLLATAKYLHESSVRRELQDRHPAEVRLKRTAAVAAAHLALRLNMRCAMQPQLLHGVDVSGSKYLNRPRVVAAANFAAAAHEGQRRRTGEPYITHCVHTAAIVEALLAQNRIQEADERWALLVNARTHA